MTAIVPATGQIWNAMPGWGIAADLTPPELAERRKLAVIRRFIAAALGALLVACVLGYVGADLKHSSAQNSLAAANSRAAQLRAKAGQYVQVTTVQGTATKITGEIAGVMATDVDFVNFLTSVRKALPNRASIQNLQVAFSTAAASAPTAANVDPSGQSAIGRVTVTGAAQSYPDVAAFVDGLNAVNGVVDVVPTSSAASQRGIAYNITFSITNAVLSHRFTTAASTGASR